MGRKSADGEENGSSLVWACDLSWKNKYRRNIIVFVGLYLNKAEKRNSIPFLTRSN